MISSIIGILTVFIINTISSAGYLGVGVLMALESCGIPIPSEIIMPFAGFVAAEGHFNFWLAAIAGAVGNLGGSLVAYAIGFYGGRPLIEKYGKWIFLSAHDLDISERWFEKRGEGIVFVGRLLPVIRTYISFPAGVAKMDLKKFMAFTLLGALPWCILFTWFGFKLQNNWELIHEKLRSLDYIALAGVLLIIIIFVSKKTAKRKVKEPV